MNEFKSVIDAEYTEALDARLSSREAYIKYQMLEARRAVPFLSKFISIQGARALEVGSGQGGKGMAYACDGMHVTAVDINAKSLAVGAAAARSFKSNIHFVVGDGMNLPFPEDMFDLVLLDSVIEHVRDPQKLLLECKRVLKPGGIVYVVFPPYFGPLSGHINDYIMVPWFHLIPSRMVEKILLSRPRKPGIATPQDALDVFKTLNGLTVFAFKRMARRAGLTTRYFRVSPFLTHPGLRLAVGFVSALKHSPRIQNLREVLGRARREFDLGTGLLFVLLGAIAPLVFVPIAQEIAASSCKCVLTKS